MAVESFAVFAHFAVNQIMKPSPRLSSRSPAAPSCLHSCPGALPDLLRPPLWCGELVNAFRLIWVLCSERMILCLDGFVCPAMGVQTGYECCYSTAPATAGLQGGIVPANLVDSCCLGPDSLECETGCRL